MRSETYVLIAIFLVAIVVRIYLEPIPFYSTAPFDADKVAFDGYYQIANNLLLGHGFSIENEAPYSPDAERTPLYPLFVAGIFKIFHGPQLLFLIQAMLGAMTAVIAYFIAKEFLSPGFAAGVGFLTALEPYTAYLTGLIMTETVFTFLFLLGFYVFLRSIGKKNIFLIASAGILLGAATLVRPTIQYLPFAFLIVMWLSWKHADAKFFKHAALFIGIFLLVLFPWLVRNYQVFGVPQISDSPDKNLYGYLAPSIMALEKNTSYADSAQSYFLQHGITEAQVNFKNAPQTRAIAIQTIAQYPQGLAESIVVTMWTFFTNDAYASMLSNIGYAVSFSHPPVLALLLHPQEFVSFLSSTARGVDWVPIVGRVFWILVSIAAIVGGVIWTRQKASPAFLLIIGTIAYFALTTVVVGLGATGRYRIPVEPLIFVLVLYALQTIFQKRPHGLEPV